MMNWLLIAAILTAILIVWLWTSHMTTNLPVLRGKSILLLIAHPDDEAMFFAPTLLRLNDPSLGNHVKILCLSSGNADGLGHIRKTELEKSAVKLGCRDGNKDVVVIEDANFPDSMNVTWNPKLIANVLTQLFAPKMARRPSNEAPTTLLNVIITFDSHGVSGHPNHISLNAGAKSFLKALMTRHAGWNCPVKLYTLTSTSILRKYLGVLDVPLSMISTVFRQRESISFPNPMVFVSAGGDYWRANRAMVTAHKSQMRWFRFGWIMFSRYMIVNDLKKEKVV